MDDYPSYTENDQDTSTNYATPLNQHVNIRKVDCTIIGAGAAGLQCAATLLKRRLSSVSSPSPNDRNETSGKSFARTQDDNISFVILEARDRVGGRILTTHEKTVTAGRNEEVELYRDHGGKYNDSFLILDDTNRRNNCFVGFNDTSHLSTTLSLLGAAWVHGAHESNPMVKLLLEAEIDSPPATQIEKATSLYPVFEGNPWIRPHTVLHGNDKKGSKSLISFFINGSFIADEVENEEEIMKSVKGVQVGDECNQESISPTSSRYSLPSLAVRRHYRVLREIALKYASGECKCENHRNVGQLYNQLNSVVDDSSTKMGNEEDEERLICLLTPFYLYLMENWNGISMKETTVEQVVDLHKPDRTSDDEEGGKEGESNNTMPQTDEQYISAGDFIGPHCKVQTGMVTVLKPLIQTLNRHQQHESRAILCLREEVVSIIDRNSHIRIETTSGKIIEAKCCVSTIPLGCLQKATSSETKASSKPFFQPSLRNEKIEAINSIWSGSYKKVFLTFDDIFWPRETPIIGLVRKEPDHCPDGSSIDLPGQHLLLYNLWVRDNIPSIEAILCGDLGKWAFQKPDTIILEAVINFIEAAMGLTDLLGSCIDCHVTRWEEDEYTRGSYSTFHLGTLDRHVDVLGSTEWDGRLVFAGEATENDHMGSVHAALMSGNRAANEVINFLSQSTNAN